MKYQNTSPAGAEFADVDLDSANFTDVRLRGAVFRNVSLYRRAATDAV